jgi:hypothetical protein
MNENIPVLEEAIELLYMTHITDSDVAAKRGEAIRAIDAMILLLGGQSAIEKLERVPYSARIRARQKGAS